MAQTPEASLNLRGMTQAEKALGVREGGGPIVDLRTSPKDIVLDAADATARWAHEHRGHIKGVLYTAGLGLVLHSLSHSGVAFGQDGPTPSPSPSSPDQGVTDPGLVNGIVSAILEKPLTVMGWITGASAAYGVAYSSWGVLKSAREVQKYNNGPEGLAELESMISKRETAKQELRDSLAKRVAPEKLEEEFQAQCVQKGWVREPELPGYDWATGRTVIMLTAFNEAVEGANVGVKLILLPQLFTAEGKAMLAQAVAMTKSGVGEAEAVAAVLNNPRLAALAVIGFFGAVATFNDVKTLFQQRIIASSGKQQRQQAA